MSSAIIPAIVAPDMGSFENGIATFKGLNPPYARGGGTPATQYLEQRCLEFLGHHTPSSEALAPHIAVLCSGQAANHVVFKALKGGDLVASKHLFGTTKVDITNTFVDEGGDVQWADPFDTQAFIDRTTEKTSAWFVEAVSNPAGRVPDFASLSAAARARNIVLVMDATLAVGMPAFRGLDHADILTVSLTKQAGGGTNQNTGGVVLVGNNYPWAQETHRFIRLQKYFADASGQIDLPKNPLGALVSKISLHEGSGVIGPDMAISIADSLPELQHRVEQMSRNAQMIADLLKQHRNVHRVQLAGHCSDPENDARARAYLGGPHFVLLVDLKGGFEAAAQVINSGHLYHAVALGQQATAISHPPSSTHRQYTKDALSAMGILDGTVRISVGTEDPALLIKRIEQALNFDLAA